LENGHQRLAPENRRSRAKLAALRLLGDALGKLEEQSQQRIARGDNPADVDRETAQAALTAVVAFFLDYGIESKPLVRLFYRWARLHGIGAGQSHGKKTRREDRTNHGCRDPPSQSRPVFCEHSLVHS
jgi:hypothetical protein